MRVRHILPEFGVIPDDPATDSMSGIVNVAYHLAKLQRENGLYTELVGIQHNGRHSGSDEPDIIGIKPWRFARVGAYNYQVYAPMTLRLMFAEPAAINHVHANPYHLTMGRAQRRILHLHTPVANVPAAYSRTVRNQAHAVICCSTFIRDQFMSEVEYPEENVFVIPGGVKVERFRPRDKQALRAQLNLPQDAFIIMYAGQINAEKGLLHLVKAIKSLDHADIHLMVAGSSRLWHSLSSAADDYERQVIEAAQDISVTFLGKIPYDTMPDAYGAADALVVPSVWDEPLGTVALEAIASGLPVIASDVGGIPDIVRHDETGLLVPRAQPEAIADAITRLRNDADLRSRLIATGLTYARDFAWPRIIERISAVYQHVKVPDAVS
ncbi:MAG: glycosyltransferase family 4 protein [Chloroflexota bacterium]